MGGARRDVLVTLEQKGRPCALAGPARPTHCLTLVRCSVALMDILPENDGIVAETPPILSYDQDVAYEDQILLTPAPPSSLADRIGRNKVYLLSENISRGSKVRV